MSTEEAEREARTYLFTGAIGSYKNPHSHRNVALDDPDEAAEIILLANQLLTDRRRPLRSNRLRHGRGERARTKVRAVPPGEG